MKRLIVCVAFALMGWGLHTANAQDQTPHPARVMVVGPATCTEDARLVPIRWRGYKPARPGGWVYRCQAFDDGGPFYRRPAN